MQLSNMLPRTSMLLLGLPLLFGCAERSDPLAPPGLPEVQALLVPIAGYSQVSAGGLHTCAIREDETVTCWGDAVPSTVPAGLAEVTQLSAGLRHTCAIDRSGSLTCWGTFPAGGSPMPADLGQVKQVSAGFNSTCVIDAADMAVCWGSNTTGHYTMPADLGPVVQIIAGYQYYCARKSDGTVRCWGDWTEPDGLIDVTDLGAGAYHICASRSDGTVLCWGNNVSGSSDVPAELTDGASADAVEVSSGEYHNCARTDAGQLICWGRDDDGQATVPDGLPPVVQVSAGYYFTCALTIHGTIACWGHNSDGQTNVPATRVNPTATFGHPTSVVQGDDFDLVLTDAHVAGFFGSTSFTYAFDCGDGSGYTDYTSQNSVSCAAGGLGERTVRGRVRDEDGDATEYTGTVATVYAFAGFFAPVDMDGVNVVRAGAAVPIKFGLGGNHGLEILANSSPASEQIACAVADVSGSMTGTDAPGNSGFSYDPAADAYTYVWKTSRSWANSCRRLTLEFIDGVSRTADFHFVK